MASGTSERERVDPVLLARRLNADHPELRARMRDVLTRPEFAPVIALPTPEYRSACWIGPASSPPRA